jgi:hypothetical protein
MANPYKKVVLARISDLSGGNPELKTLVISAVSGTATISGFFVDARGDQLGQLVSLSITSETTLANALTPQQENDSGWSTGKAVGFVGRLSGSALYFGTGGNPDNGNVNGGMSLSSAYPRIEPSEYFTLGRCGQIINSGIGGVSSGTAQGSYGTGPALNYYALVSEGGTSNVSVEILNTDSVVIYRGVLNITTTAKSLDNWLSSATPTTTFSSNMKSVRVYDVAGYAILINTGGNGTPATNNGIVSGYEPNTTYSTRVPVGSYNMQYVGFGAEF